MNLISNSIDALADKNGGEITISAELQSAKVIVHYSDNGPGIDKSVAQRLFEAFYTTKTAENGSGLGMYIVRSEIEKNGGSIQVEESSSGAKFLIILPTLEIVNEA